MVLGLERREVVKDPNAGSKVEFNAAPLPAIMKPNPSSFSELGNTDYSGAMKSVGDAIKQYEDNENDKKFINGKLALAQGKTEKEIYDTGDRYTIAGWETMKLQTDMDVFEKTAMQDIADTSHTLDPNVYRAQKEKEFGAISDRLQNADPLVRQALVSHVEKVFPSLMATQTVAHNNYVHKQQGEAYGNMLVTQTDPTKAQEVMRTAGGELPVDEKKRIIAQAAKRATDDGNPTIQQALALSNTNVIANPDPTAILDLIGKGESGGNYNAIAGNRNEPNLSRMTIDQVLAYQKGLINNGDESSAAGKYQFINGTLQGLKDKLKLKGDEVFDSALQDKLALAKLQERGFDKFVNDPRTLDSFVTGLSQEWAALPKDSSGAGTYDGQGTNKANIHYGELHQALTASLTNSQTRQVLIDQGFSPEDQDMMMNAFKDMATANSNKYSQDRIKLEDSISTAARQEGNLPKSLKQIQEAKDKYGFSDAWANQQANSVQSEINKFKAEKDKLKEVDLAISQGTAGALSSEKQQMAIDRVDAQNAVAFPASTSPDHPNYSKDRSAAIDQKFKFMYRNNMTDKRVGQQWESAIQGDIVNPDGTVKPTATTAYNDYRQAIQSTGNKPWVTGQMSQETQDMFNLADTYMNGSTTFSPDQALVAAQAALANKLPEGQKHTLNPIEAARTTRDLIEATIPDMWTLWGLGNSQAEYRWSISEESVNAAAKDPAVLNAVSALAGKYLSTSTIANKSAATQNAFEKAKNHYLAHTEYVMGSFVNTGDEPTLSKQLGSDRANEANRVASEVLAYIGPIKYKDKWNSTDMLDHSQSWYEDQSQNPISKGAEWVGDAVSQIGSKDTVLGVPNLGNKVFDKLRGVPDAKVMYNPTSKAVIIWPYSNYSRTQTLEPIILSVETMKELSNRMLTSDRTMFKKFIDDNLIPKGSK